MSCSCIGLLVLTNPSSYFLLSLHSTSLSTGSSYGSCLQFCFASSPQRGEARKARWFKSAQHAKVAIAVYVLGGYNCDLAEVFVRQKSKRIPNKDEDLGQMVHDMFLAMPLNSAVRIEVPESDFDSSICNTALKFIAEHNTSKFVGKANEEKGVAPSSHDAATEYMRQCERLGVQSPSTSLHRALDDAYVDHRTSRRQIRKWSQKIRCNWGLGFGALRSRNPLPQAENLEKAGLVMVSIRD